jgi:hypothetical protein
LVGNLLRCAMNLYRNSGHHLEFVRIFISHAQPDGTGTDLTGGAPPCQPQPPTHRGDVHPESNELWPDNRFRGARQLVETLYRWYCSPWRPHGLQLYAASMFIPRFEQIRHQLTAALLRIRTYRRTIRSTCAQPLDAGAVHAIDLRSIILAYLLVPLYDQSQLEDPLLDQPLEPPCVS